MALLLNIAQSFTQMEHLAFSLSILIIFIAPFFMNPFKYDRNCTQSCVFYLNYSVYFLDYIARSASVPSHALYISYRA